ncbi:MAG: hypothetical protein ACKVTZ_10340 [Bacteroidia bacterium]
MKLQIGIITFCLGVFMLLGCRKEPGVGGNASIKGRIFVEKYNKTFTVLLQKYYVAEQDVYIVYGDQYGYSDRVKTDYDGRFAFDYLYPGDYTVYVMSKDSTFATGDTIGSGEVPVKKELTLKQNKEAVDLGEITILEN